MRILTLGIVLLAAGVLAGCDQSEPSSELLSGEIEATMAGNDMLSINFDGSSGSEIPDLIIQPGLNSMNEAYGLFFRGINPDDVDIQEIPIVGDPNGASQAFDLLDTAPDIGYTSHVVLEDAPGLLVMRSFHDRFAKLLITGLEISGREVAFTIKWVAQRDGSRTLHD